MDKETVRLNKYLSASGICSRREADRQIASGNVTVNGKKAVMGQQVCAGDEVVYRGRRVCGKNEPVLLLFHKPIGIVCTSEKREPHNIIDFVNYPTRLYPVGRLDKDSRGLILLTNQGDLANRILPGRNRHEKEYIVRVDRPLQRDFIQKMAAGVYLPELEVTTRPCRIKQQSKYTFSIVLTQGLNRQIRRMCQVLGYHVRDLKRVRIMNLELGNLKEGEYRPVTGEEYRQLLKLLESTGENEPWNQGKR